jgi:hypothetical protein
MNPNIAIEAAMRVVESDIDCIRELRDSLIVSIARIGYRICTDAVWYGFNADSMVETKSRSRLSPYTSKRYDYPLFTQLYCACSNNRFQTRAFKIITETEDSSKGASTTPSSWTISPIVLGRTRRRKRFRTQEDAVLVILLVAPTFSLENLTTDTCISNCP